MTIDVPHKSGGEPIFIHIPKLFIVLSNKQLVSIANYFDSTNRRYLFALSRVFHNISMKNALSGLLLNILHAKRSILQTFANSYFTYTCNLIFN